MLRSTQINPFLPSPVRTLTAVLEGGEAKNRKDTKNKTVIMWGVEGGETDTYSDYGRPAYVQDST